MAIHAMPMNVMLCYPCHSNPCHINLWYTSPCHTNQYDNILCHTNLWHTNSWLTNLCPTKARHANPCHIYPCQPNPLDAIKKLLVQSRNREGTTQMVETLQLLAFLHLSVSLDKRVHSLNPSAVCIKRCTNLRHCGCKLFNRSSLRY